MPKLNACVTKPDQPFTQKDRGPCHAALNSEFQVVDVTRRQLDCGGGAKRSVHPAPLSAWKAGACDRAKGQDLRSSPRSREGSVSEIHRSPVGAIAKHVGPRHIAKIGDRVGVAAGKRQTISNGRRAAVVRNSVSTQKRHVGQALRNVCPRGREIEKTASVWSGSNSRHHRTLPEQCGRLGAVPRRFIVVYRCVVTVTVACRLLHAPKARSHLS